MAVPTKGSLPAVKCKAPTCPWQSQGEAASQELRTLLTFASISDLVSKENTSLTTPAAIHRQQERTHPKAGLPDCRNLSLVSHLQHTGPCPAGEAARPGSAHMTLPWQWLFLRLRYLSPQVLSPTTQSSPELCVEITTYTQRPPCPCSERYRTAYCRAF